MTVDAFKRRLLELALDLRDPVATEFAADDGEACARCDRRAVDADGLESETAIEYYAVPCPVADCDGEASFAHLYVAIDDEPRLVNRTFAGVGCTTTGCDPSGALEAALLRDREPFERIEYRLPVAGLVATTVRTYRVEAEPGETVRVCRTCRSARHEEAGPAPDEGAARAR